jgi:hypothetical protein
MKSIAGAGDELAGYVLGMGSDGCQRDAGGSVSYLKRRGGWKLDGSDYEFLFVVGIPLGTLLGAWGRVHVLEAAILFSIG